jgi:hypothetical protein
MPTLMDMARVEEARNLATLFADAARNDEKNGTLTFVAWIPYVQVRIASKQLLEASKANSIQDSLLETEKKRLLFEFKRNMKETTLGE